MLINDASLNVHYDGCRTASIAGFAGAESAYREVAIVVPSTIREETYGWLGQFPKMREWVGDRHVRNLAAHSYKIANRDFEQTIRNDIADDQYGLFAPRFQEIGRTAAEFPDEFVFA